MVPFNLLAFDSVLKKFDYTCERRHIGLIFQFSLLVIAAISNFPISVLSDKYGRKPTFLIVLM